MEIPIKFLQFVLSPFLCIGSIKAICHSSGIFSEEITPILTAEPEISQPTQKEVTSIIKNLKNYKAPGSDSITAELFKNGRPELEDINIYKLINLI